MFWWEIFIVDDCSFWVTETPIALVAAFSTPFIKYSYVVAEDLSRISPVIGDLSSPIEYHPLKKNRRNYQVAAPGLNY
jgi:hypothetical protein